MTLNPGLTLASTPMPLESMHHPHPDIAPNADRSADPITDPITDLSADALSQAIHARSLSCREVMQAYLNRIHRLNPALNADRKSVV